MPLILSIETATSVCSVALHKDGELVGMQELHLQKSHSGYLAVLIKDILHYANYTLKDIEIIALSKGPGSYTGLRIGAATAKGLCYALDIPLLSVNTLEAMASSIGKYYRQSDYLLCPMIDARRMEVYCLITDSQMNIIEDTKAVIVDELVFKDYLDLRPVIFFGDGAAKCKDILSTHPNAVFIDDITPSALNIGLSASGIVKQNRVFYEDLAYFEPFYLKEYQAKKSVKGFSNLQ